MNYFKEAFAFYLKGNFSFQSWIFFFGLEFLFLSDAHLKRS